MYMRKKKSEYTPMMLLAVRGLNLLGKPFGINPIARPFSNSATGDAAEISSAFDNIYIRQGWQSAESRSGIGSEVNRASGYRIRLENYLTKLGATRIFDAPCGDLNWIAPLATNARWKYIGGDVSAALVHDVRMRYPELDVRHFDICGDAFPAADVWHCRDCLFHLPLKEIRAALERFVESSIPYALLTTHRARLLHRNLDVPVGGFRYLDLQRPPIFLPTPLHYLRDYRRGLDFPRYVGAWRKQDIADALCRWDKV